VAATPAPDAGAAGTRAATDAAALVGRLKAELSIMGGEMEELRRDR
jgi:hypothetical protein